MSSIRANSRFETLARQAEALLAAHHSPSPLVLPNAWDVASAKVVEAAGFRAIATSSRAIADVLGEPDNDASEPWLLFELLARIARAVPVPLTADLQAGLGLDAEGLVDRILEAGVVGCNLEDTDHHGDGVLVAADRQATYLGAVRQAAAGRGVHLVVNARVDTFVRKAGDLEEQLSEGVRRARLYLEAGADCVYPIALDDPDTIRAFVRDVPGPVNIIARRDGPTIAELASLGVRRISLGSGLHQLAMAHLGAAVSVLARGGTIREAWPPESA